MKFSEMLGEPDPARETPEESEPISVFAPVPTTPPPASTWLEEPVVPPEPATPASPSQPGPAMPGPAMPGPAMPAPRSGLAEVNVLSAPAAPTEQLDTFDEVTELAGLGVVDDDLLPSARRSRK